MITEEGEIDLAVVLDEETERWPVQPPLRGELNRIKFEYRAVPLPMYVNDKFIEPVNVNSAIKGTLVELHFELHHFPIQKVAQDSFNATIEQIIVLRPGEARPMTAYKRKNLCVGPILAQLTLPLQNQTGEGSCTGKVVDKCWVHLAALWTLGTWTLTLDYGLVD